MNNINDHDTFTKSLSKRELETETKRRNKKNKYQRERYKRTVRINPVKIRPNTKKENQRKKEIINKRQALLQTQQTTNKNKSKEKIQGKNEK